MPERVEKVESEHAGVTGETLTREIEAMVVELHPQLRDKLRVTLDSSLDRDLGLDSLARMELLARLQRAFDVELPEQAVVRAETPRDLLASLLSASPPRNRDRSQRLAIREPRERTDAGAPGDATTLSEVLMWHARTHPERTHVHLCDEQENSRAISYAELTAGARRVAAGLGVRGLDPGRAVAIMLPTGVEYLHSFLGVLLAGGVPVPVYPPFRLSQIEDHVRRHVGILSNADVGALITFAQAKPVAALLKSQVQTLRHVLTVEELSTAGELAEVPRLDADDVAFIQYTSGSTGNPKGVVLSHANLLANIRAMGEAIEVRGDEVFVSWLPLYHDMGLIGAWLGSLYYGFPLVLMSPLSFLGRPARWLRAIHRFQGTLSAGPNFAYELCIRRIEEQEIEGLDLSSWRMAFNGAEPVSADTLERFSERFVPCGLSPNAIAPVYGLAEATLGVAFPPPGRGLLVDRIEREALTRRDRAVPAASDSDDTVTVVACGQPLPGYQVRVVDGTGRELPERRQGRLQFNGPSTTRGYFRNPEATAELFEDGWLNSGDLAYIAGGDIYVTGRSKDVIIRAGRNLYPYELESAVGDIGGIRTGCVAVFGSPDPLSQTERLVVVAETREQDPQSRDALEDAIKTVSVDVLGTPPDIIALAPPRTVLKTSSGKIRRLAVRELFESGAIGARRNAVWLQLTRLAVAGLGPSSRRALGALAGFAYAAFAWLATVLIGVPAWLAVVLLPSASARWKSAHWGAHVLLGVTGTSLSVRGLEHVPTDTAFVLVANHQSYLDGMVLLAALPSPLGFVAKRELAGNFVTGWFLSRLGTHFVERFDRRQGVEDARRVARSLARGHSLGYFPEGTFRRMPGLLPFHMGAFTAAVESDVPVVPVTLRGTRSILRAEGLFPRPGAIQVQFHEPVRSDTPGTEPASTWSAAVALRDAARARILEHCAEPDLADQRQFL